MTFTASNGIPITTKVSGDGRSYLLGMTDAVTHATASEEGIKALREFFQHEKDEQLGRWRSKNDPAWTAVRHEGNVTFQHEHGTRSFNITINDTASLGRWTKELQAIAHEYLDAHPEPKPIPSEPRTAWVDKYGTDVWHVGTDGILRCVLSPGSDPAKYAPFTRLVPEATA